MRGRAPVKQSVIAVTNMQNRDGNQEQSVKDSVIEIMVKSPDITRFLFIAILAVSFSNCRSKHDKEIERRSLRQVSSIDRFVNSSQFHVVILAVVEKTKIRHVGDLSEDSPQFSEHKAFRIIEVLKGDFPTVQSIVPVEEKIEAKKYFKLSSSEKNIPSEIDKLKYGKKYLVSFNTSSEVIRAFKAMLYWNVNWIFVDSKEFDIIPLGKLR